MRRRLLVSSKRSRQTPSRHRSCHTWDTNVLHTEPRAARVLKLTSFAAAGERLSLSDCCSCSLADGLLGTYFATVTHDNRPVNVHLSPFGVRRGSTFRQAFQAISAVETVHQTEIESVAAKVDSSHPTLVCGDFNSVSTFSAPLRLVSLGLNDSFASVTEDADSHPTWRWPVGRFHIQFRIDYIFHTNHFTTVSSGIVATTGSDHFLVVTEVAWERPSTAG